VRAQEGSTARAHGIGETWINALTTTDFDAFLKADGSTTTGNAVIQAGTTASVPLSLAGLAGQTANILEIESTLGTVTARIAADGSIYGSALYDNGNRVYSSSNPVPDNALYAHLAGTETFTGNKTFSGTAIFTGSTTRVGSTTAGTLTIGDGTITKNSGSQFVLNQGINAWNVTVAEVDINSNTTGTIPLQITGFAGQTGNLTEWRNSTPSILSYVNSSGQIFDNGNRVYSSGNANLSSTTPTAETYGLAGAVGTGTTYARADHAHAMPATPVTSAVAGTGIGVSGATGAVTFTNTGVTSIVAGSGVSINQGTGTVTISATGTTISPATTVTSETTYGIAAAVGTGLLYARNDHTHGTPATPVTSIVAGSGISINQSTGAVTITSTGGVSPATTVTSETTYGIASAVGTGTLYARNDHTHGTPALPTTAQIAPGTFTGAYTFASNATGIVPLVSKGFAGQTARLTEWQDSAGSVLAHINSFGSLTFTSTGSFVSGIDGRADFRGGTATTIPLSIRGFTGQTGNLTEWKDPTGTTILSRVASDGTIWVGATQLGGGGSGSATDTETMSIMGGF
jgi:hypothetical protein